MTPLLELRQVGLQAPQRPRLGPVNLTLPAGERVALLGPSGAGKSSLLRLISGEWLPSQGELCLQGRPMRDWQVAERARRRALLPQQHRVAFALPVPLVVGLGRLAAQEDEAQRQRFVREALCAACAEHLSERRVDSLSGGELARVMLARVLAQLWDVEGGLLLVDEPLAALDPGLQLELRERLLGFARKRGHALVSVLHDLPSALQDHERLWLMRDGRIEHDMPAALPAAIEPLERLFGVRLRVWQTPGEAPLLQALAA